jgi:asparagine synthase (glutamine-hydrolysing)
MCGFLGVAGKESQCPELEFSDALRLRGPDSQNSINEFGVEILHSLLSLQGNVPTPQPIKISDHSLLAWNGEIYNFKELEPNVQCDTDLLVGQLPAGLETSRFRGMFAIAATREQAIEIYRDQFGIKPLYFAQVENHLYFGSIAKDVSHAAFGHKSSLNWLSLYQWARFRRPLNNRSFYDGVSSLEANSKLRFDTQTGLASKSDLADYQIEKTLPILKNALRASIKEQLGSNSGCAVFLSGGLDSSLIAAMAREFESDLKTYSVAFEGSEEDESNWVKRVSEHIGSDHTYIAFSPEEFQSELVRMIGIYGEPCAVPNEVAISILSKSVRQSFKCVLSGEGADELFGGYSELTMMARNIPTISNSQIQGQNFKARYEYLSHDEVALIFRKYVSESELIEFQQVTDHEFMQSLSNVHDPSDALLWLQKNHLPSLLSRLDKATMVNSLEGRVPFLDPRIASISRSIHWKEMMLASSEDSSSPLEPKAPLKRVAESYLPKDIVYRKKVGFPVPRSYYGGSRTLQGPDYSSWVALNLKILIEGK